MASIALGILLLLLFPLALQDQGAIANELATAVFFLMTLVLNSLYLNEQFHEDFDDGTLKQVALQPLGLLQWIWARFILTWCCLALLLGFLAVTLVLLYQQPHEIVLILLIHALLFNVYLIQLALFISALTTSITKNGGLFMLLLLPFSIPALIAALDSFYTFSQTQQMALSTSLLIGLATLSMALLPWLGAYLLRLQLNYG